MNEQMSLPPIIDRDLVEAIRGEMGVYTNVAIIDGAFHRPWGNVNRPDRNGRSHVHGLITRCGVRLEIDTPTHPHWGTMPLDRAAAQTHGCPDCFETIRARL